MVVLDGNFAVGCGPGTDYPEIHIFQCMLERKAAITNGVLKSITFVLAYPIYIHFLSLVLRTACPAHLSFIWSS
jgi:hypothetical protein